LNKELYTEWLHSTQTLEIFRELEKFIGAQVEDIASGESLRMDSVDETALITARKVGFIDGLRTVLRMEFIEDE
jgi:hypothetical protein